MAFAQTYQNDVGYVRLQGMLGGNTPTSAGVSVTQIEASLVAMGNPGYPEYAPTTTEPYFSGKSFFFPPGTTPSAADSDHATGVGSVFYGTDGTAPGITSITVYWADDWITYLATPGVAAPYKGSRVANDSWVGAGSTTAQSETILRLADRLTQLTGETQAVGMAPSIGNPLLADAFNVISVGETAHVNFLGTNAIDSIYVTGRASPALVVPEGDTSAAAPAVAAAAAMLVAVGHNGGSSLSSGSTNVSGVGTIYDAEQPATVKAILMAGADRITANTSSSANVQNYASGGNQTSNGLDTRYGAGQLDLQTSYEIIVAGEQHSLQGGSSSGGAISTQGFDYSGAFGGTSGTPTTATYKFTAASNAMFSATLAWNLGIANNSTLATTFYSMNLELVDTSGPTVIANSTSTIDNTQNLWVAIVAGHSYQLLVTAAGSNPFSWPYSLAWSTAATPGVSASAPLIVAGQESTLTATAIGSGPFTYQWYQGTSGDTSAPISGANSATYTTPALSTTTSYWVRITTPRGFQNSATITVSVQTSGNGPMPTWSLLLLAAGLVALAARRIGSMQAG